MTDERISLGDDTGYVEVELAGVTRRLDLYATAARLRGLLESAGGDYLPAMRDYVVSLGYPDSISVGAADRFGAAVLRRYGEQLELLKKSGAA